MKASFHLSSPVLGVLGCLLLGGFTVTGQTNNETQTGQQLEDEVQYDENLQEQQQNEGNECLGFEAHFVTFYILQVSMMVTPFYLLATWVYSNPQQMLTTASIRPGMELAWIWLIMGGVMTCICLYDVDGQLGTPGNLIIPVAWFIPSILLGIFRNRYHSAPLSQHWLVGLQLWRAIGGIFLIEMARGNLPEIFAYPAGIGDLIVAFCALVILLKYRNQDVIPSFAVYFLIVIGVADFLSAFFFGFFSSGTEAQLFFHDAKHNPSTYPTGLIPLFLVPYAIFFHTLSFINERRYFSGGNRDDAGAVLGETQAASKNDVLATQQDMKV